MHWTYSGDPANSNLDAVRFLIGDTNQDDQQLNDEEVNWVLAQNSSAVYLTAAQACRMLAAKYARLVDESADVLRLSYSQRQKGYLDLAAQLDRQASIKTDTAAPYAGGISLADKDKDETDSDVTPPAFRIGMHDNLG